MALTKEQWQVLEEQLNYQFGLVKLKCDGYEVQAKVEKGKGLKLHIMVYIDGWFKGEWLVNKDERCLKFFRKQEKYTLSNAMRIHAKRMLRSRYEDVRKHAKTMLESKVSVWTPYWPSAKSFFRHIRKTCHEIEVME